MILVPLATGAVAASRLGINISALSLFVLAALSLFWLRTPVESWLGTSPIKAQTAQERALVSKFISVVAVFAAASIAALLRTGYSRGLLLIGAVSALAFGLQAGVKKLGGQGRMPAQVIGAIGLTSTAAGAYYVASGRLDRTALALWFANWLFAADQIPYVQVRIHAGRASNLREKLRQGRPFLVGQIGLITAVMMLWRVGVFPAIAALAFIPVLLRGTLWFVRGPQPLDVHKLGFSELAQALIFGVLVSAAFAI